MVELCIHYILSRFVWPPTSSVFGSHICQRTCSRVDFRYKIHMFLQQKKNTETLSGRPVERLISHGTTQRPTFPGFISLIVHDSDVEGRTEAGEGGSKSGWRRKYPSDLLGGVHSVSQDERQQARTRIFPHAVWKLRIEAMIE